MITLKDYGDLCSYQSYVLENEKMKFMYYRNYDTNDNLEISFSEDSNFYSATHKNTKKDILYGNNSYIDIINNLNIDKYNPPICRTYENSKQQGDCFCLDIESYGKKFEFSFSKDRCVVVRPDFFNCSVFDISEQKENNFNNLSEHYQFMPSGFFSSNIKEKYFTYYNDNFTLDFNSLLENKEFDCMLIDICPTIIKYFKNENDTEVFKIKYDEFGIPVNIINNKKELCRTESRSDEDYIIETISVHPHLFDPFNYNYIDEPLLYWAADHISVSNDGIFIIERRIYKIDKEKLSSLIEDIDSTKTDSILYEYKDYIIVSS